VLDFLGNLERTNLCGTLRAADAGKPVVLMGWVNRRRDTATSSFSTSATAPHRPNCSG